MKLSDAMKTIWSFVSRSNKYIDETAPWKLAKNPDQKSELAATLYNLVESLRVISIMISPAMPLTSRKIWKQLGLDSTKNFDEVQLDDIENLRIEFGHRIEKPEQLFPRIEVEKS